MSTFSLILEGPLNTLALNRDYTQVATGGRNVFKIFSIEEDSFKEVCNLRSPKYQSHISACNHISWSPTDDHCLAAAATNGELCVWNLSKGGKAVQEQVYYEHKRTVNKINFHATEPNKLISCCQDGTIRYFDVRCKSSVAIFISNTESVRDVQFSPYISHMFAAVSENGSVQLWDIRKPEKCQQQFTAHSGPIFTCDWHPENMWLATASRDKTIKVWDLTAKPTLEHVIHSMTTVGYIKWRPQRKYHIASCALVVDLCVNIWDVRRPYIPFATFDEHKDMVSGVVFRSDPQFFLSCGRDSMLIHHSFKDANRPANKANPQSLSINNNGDVLFAHRLPINNTFSKSTGLIRKSSNTAITDQFLQATSAMYRFQTTFSQDANCFYNLSANYILSGRSFSEICDHNAAVAKAFDKSNINIIWKIIKTIYGEEFCQPHYGREDKSSSRMSANRQADCNVDEQYPKDDETGDSDGDDDNETDGDQTDNTTSSSLDGFIPPQYRMSKGDFSFGDNDFDRELDILNMDFRNSLTSSSQMAQQDWTLPNEAFNLRHEILDRSPPPEQFQNCSPDINDECQPPPMYVEKSKGLLSISKPPMKELWDPGNIVVDALKYHATLGDIQTAVTVLIVLGDRRKSLKTLDESTQEHWLFGYLEMLNRFKLWNVATEVIKLSWISSVNQLNQQSTQIVTECSQCKKRLQRSSWLCDRCHNKTVCSVCHQVVKGLYSWCQECAHGGHLIHIQEWFKTNKTCPSGCGHACEYGF